MNIDGKEKLRKKLHYNSTHRGMKENDLILGKFAVKFLFQMNEQELIDYKKILDQNDEVIYKLIAKGVVPSIDLDSLVTRKLVDFATGILY